MQWQSFIYSHPSCSSTLKSFRQQSFPLCRPQLSLSGLNSDFNSCICEKKKVCSVSIVTVSVDVDSLWDTKKRGLRINEEESETKKVSGGFLIMSHYSKAPTAKNTFKTADDFLLNSPIHFSIPWNINVFFHVKDIVWEMLFCCLA